MITLGGKLVQTYQNWFVLFLLSAKNIAYVKDMIKVCNKVHTLSILIKSILQNVSWQNHDGFQISINMILSDDDHGTQRISKQNVKVINFKRPCLNEWKSRKRKVEVSILAYCAVRANKNRVYQIWWSHWILLLDSTWNYGMWWVLALKNGRYWSLLTIWTKWSSGAK